MNINPLVISVGEKIGVPVFPDICTETGLDRYITFNYVSEHGNLFGDNRALSEETEIQVHYFMRNCNVQTEKRKLRKYLNEAGFTQYSGAELYENDTRYNHIVVICTISGEPDYYD